MLKRSGLAAATVIAVAQLLAGTGVASSTPVLVWTPTTSAGAYDFGAVAPGQSRIARFTLTNRGGSATSALTTTLAGSVAFVITTNSCMAASLSPNRSCAVTVRYTPVATNPGDAATLAATGRKPNTNASLALAGTSVLPRQIYWANTGLDTMGRANIDGTGANQEFMTGSFSPQGLAVDRSHLYWANGASVGRSDLDGQNINARFLVTSGAIFGVEVDAAHLYWAQTDPDPTVTGIGRSDLDGQNATEAFITGTIDPFDVAADAAHLYWADCGRNAIGRADLDGQNVNLSFISGASCPLGVAVDSGHLYWTNYGTYNIGRADIDGLNANQAFITGASFPFGITVDSTHIYWTNVLGDSIGRADLNGQNVNQMFITDAASPRGVAVDPG